MRCYLQLPARDLFANPSDKPAEPQSQNSTQYFFFNSWPMASQEVENFVIEAEKNASSNEPYFGSEGQNFSAGIIWFLQLFPPLLKLKISLFFDV